MSASADVRSSPEVYVVTDDPYTVLKVEQALRSPGTGTVAQLLPRDLPAVRVQLETGASRASGRPVTFLVPADLLAESELPGSIVIGYGTAEALDLRIDSLCFDYITVPWSDAELRYRVRRAGTGRSIAFADGVISWGRNWISAERSDGSCRHTTLSSTEAVLLDLLIASAGETVSRAVLHAAVGAPANSDSRAMDMRVSRLRVRIREVTADWRRPPVITSDRGNGYQFSCQ